MSFSPKNPQDLLQRAEKLAGMTLNELAIYLEKPIPNDLLHAKGVIGQWLEIYLGATAGIKSAPDFEALQIELKTIPMNRQGKPLETTYVCTVPLMNVTGMQWQNSCVYRKLQHVLWIPIIVDDENSIGERVIGAPFLWRWNTDEEHLLRADWEEHMEKIALGDIETITARAGTYLQMRPKAADSHALTDALGRDGQIIKTLPRGFYLRTEFSGKLLAKYYLF